MYKLTFSIILVAISLHISTNGFINDLHYRLKRQIPLCTDGNQAVAQCFATLTCNGGYRCETGTRLCCRATSMPTCPNGLPASAGCIGGGCGAGLICLTVGTQGLCCRVCPNNATSTGLCTSNAQCTATNTQCNLIVGRTTDTQGLCCPPTSTVSPSTPSSPRSSS